MEFKSITPFTKETIIVDSGDEDTSYLGYIEGLAATNFKDRYGDIISDDALKKGASDLLGNNTVFLNHRYDVENAVGKVIETSFVSDGVKSGISVRVGISKTATKIWTKIKEGILKSFSIGGIWKEVNHDKENDAYIIKDLELYELSIVGIPANPTCSFSSLALKFIDDIKAKEHIKREEEDIMSDNTKFENEITSLKTQIGSIKEMIEGISKKDTDTTDVRNLDIVKDLTENVKVLTDGVAPIIEERSRQKKLAERRSAAIQTARDELENMPHREKQKLEMTKIIEATLDPTVHEVVLVADLNPIPPIHERSVEEIKEEKRRVGVA